MAHEWVSEGYVIGFTTDKGLIMDLDNLTFRTVKWIANQILKRHKLEGYLIVRSSEKSYHLIFNKYLRWKTITEILFKYHESLRWAVMQMRFGVLTLRISKKNGKNKPTILLRAGKQDKLIKDYLEIYEAFEEY